MPNGTDADPTDCSCKIKRVYPRLPLHVHSAVGQALTEIGAVYRARVRSTSGWSNPEAECRAEGLR